MPDLTMDTNANATKTFEIPAVQELYAGCLDRAGANTKSSSTHFDVSFFQILSESGEYRETRSPQPSLLIGSNLSLSEKVMINSTQFHSS